MAKRDGSNAHPSDAEFDAEAVWEKIRATLGAANDALCRADFGGSEDGAAGDIQRAHWLVIVAREMMDRHREDIAAIGLLAGCAMRSDKGVSA